MPVSTLHKRKFTKNLAILAAIFTFCALVWITTMIKMASAANIVQCSQPVSGDIKTTPEENYCDIHARRLDYGEENRKYHDQLQERRENFIAPSREAKRNYNMNRDALQNGDTYNP